MKASKKKKVTHVDKPIHGLAHQAAAGLCMGTEDAKLEAIMASSTSPIVILGLIRYPAIEKTILEAISQNRRWIGYYDILAALCFQPRTPTHIAIQLVQRLYAVDLIKLLGQVRLAPALRATAANLLETRISALSAGERIGIARLAKGSAAGFLLSLEDDLKVLTTLLDMPALREIDVLKSIHAPKATAQYLALVGRHRKWSARIPIRSALVLQRKTPLDLALSLLTGLPIQDLRPILKDEALSPVLRMVAKRYIEEKQGLGPFSRKETQ